MPSKDKYTDPELRDQVKEEIHESDKGGAPGQWSARKAQMMAQEYKKRGGSYNTDKNQKDESQQNLSKWGEEEWQTKEGSGHAKKEDGTEKRYLPKKAWSQMTDEEKEETDAKKQEESKKGKQHVENTGNAKASRKQAVDEKNKKRQHGSREMDRDESTNEKDAAAEEEGSESSSAEDNTEDNVAQHEDEDDDFQDDVMTEDESGEEDAGHVQSDGDEGDTRDEPEQTGRKRKQSNGSQSNGSSKRQKDGSGKSTSKANLGSKTKAEGKSKAQTTVGSKHMSADEPAPKGSVDRLPKEGQKATWKALPGYVEGEVMEIVTNNQTVDGKSVKASNKDPRIVLKSASSGKICVHKPEACFYEDA